MLCLIPSSCKVSDVGQPLHPTPKAYCLLELFLRHGFRLFSRSAIIDQLWSFEDPLDEDTVKAHTKGLRQKLRSVGRLMTSFKQFMDWVIGLIQSIKPLKIF